MFQKNLNWRIICLLLIFLILLVSNIIMVASLVDYYIKHHDFQFSLILFENIFSMVSAIIILGFISTRLPQFRNLGDSSIYEIGYLIILGVFGILLSYFNASTNSGTFIGPFLGMFRILSVLLILLIIASKTKSFNNVLNHKATKKDLFVSLIIFAILGCVASVYYVPVHDSLSNVRNLIVMIAGLFGGPVVGIPVGLIAGCFRFIQGGSTAFPCSIATIVAGALGSLIYVINNKKFLKGFSAVILIFLYVGFEMMLIVVLTPPSISIGYINDIYPLMVFGSVLGMILFLMIIKEDKYNAITYEEMRINEFENTLDEYQDKIDQLEEEIELLKNKND